MRDTFRLPATAQHQVWLEGILVDVGSPVAFDAHGAMIGLHIEQFSRVAREICSGGKNGSELALASSETQKWWFSSIDNAYAVTVDPFEFEDWLDSVGLTIEEAVNIDGDGLAGLLARVSRDVPAGRPSRSERATSPRSTKSAAATTVTGAKSWKASANSAFQAACAASPSIPNTPGRGDCR